MFLVPETHRRSAARAIYQHGRWWTYAELAAEVSRRAQSLRGRKRLAFCFCRMDVSSIVNYLACMEAGHAVALLDAALPADIREDLVARYQPELLLDSSGEARLSPHDGSAEQPHPDLAVLLSTSGTTGSPKFVRLSRHNLVSNAASIRAALAIGECDRAMCSLPFQYSYGLSVVNSHLLAGASLAISGEGLMSTGFWDTCRDAACTSMAGVPYSYQVLRRLGVDALRVPSLTTLTQAGGKLSTELIAEFHAVIERRGGRFFVMYGQTEATARMAILPAADLPRKLGSAGRAIPGGFFQIRRDDGSMASQPREQGELVYSGPNVMMGYATGRGELALGDTAGGRLETGDLAYLDEEGYLYVSGRMRRDAKVAGLRINLDEVEGMLKGHGPTAAVAGNNKLLIFCEYGDGQMLAGLRADLAARLRLNHHALEFRRVESLPLNHNGKIDYAVLGAAR